MWNDKEANLARNNWGGLEVESVGKMGAQPEAGLRLSR